jgi:hypothetical protein
MKVNELLQEYISRETFNSVVKKTCLKHGIKTGVRTTTEFNHDKGILVGTVIIKIVSATYDKGKYIDVNFGKFNQKVIDEIIADCQRYGVSSLIEPHSRYSYKPPKRVPLDTKFPLEQYVQSGEEVEFKLVFGAEEKTEFEDVFLEEKSELENLINSWQKSTGFISHGTPSGPNEWIDWHSVGTPGMSLIPNFEKGLLQKDQTKALKNLTDDPEMLKAIDDRNKKKIGPKFENRMAEIEKQKNEMLATLKPLIANFNAKAKACKAVVAVVKTELDQNGGPIEKRSVRYVATEITTIVPQIKVSLRKDMVKFEKSSA